jgi:hypothetical protein
MRSLNGSGVRCLRTQRFNGPHRPRTPIVDLAIVAICACSAHARAEATNGIRPGVGNAAKDRAGNATKDRAQAWRRLRRRRGGR